MSHGLGPQINRILEQCSHHMLTMDLLHVVLLLFQMHQVPHEWYILRAILLDFLKRRADSFKFNLIHVCFSSMKEKGHVA